MKAMDSGQRRLRELGFKQRLDRGLSWQSNTAITFSIISPLTAVTGLYIQGLLYGGPVALVWGWVITSIFTCLVGLSMSELCSAFPQSGGLYFYSYSLGVQHGPFWSWLTGWLNVMGQLAFVAGNEYTFVQTFAVMLLLATGTATGGGYVMSVYEQLCMLASLLVCHACINSLDIKHVARAAHVSSAWMLAGVVAIIATLLALTDKKQSWAFVFTSFQMNPTSGVTSAPWTFFLGMATACWSLTGYDSTAHLIEETASADSVAGRPMLVAIGASCLAGFGYLLALTFCIQDYDYVLDPSNETAGGSPVAQIFWDTFQKHYGSGRGGIFLLGIPLVSMWFCGLTSMTSAARMLYSFSRDGAMPAGRFWHQIDPPIRVPMNAAWGVAIGAFLLSLGLLNSITVFLAVTSIATAGLAAAYSIPVWLRSTLPKHNFDPGPFSLGRHGRLISLVSAIWLTFVVATFMLPAAMPVTMVPGPPLALACIVVPALVMWLWVGRWFHGPSTDILNSDAVWVKPYVSDPLRDSGVT